MRRPVPEKSREQWHRAVRRWTVVGAAAGVGFGTFAHVAWDAAVTPTGLLGSLAFSVPMGAALVLVLWAPAYRYEFAKVWGWTALGLTVGLLVLLMATGIGVGCLQGICGER